MRDIGFAQALDLARKNISTLGHETVPTSELVGRVCAEDAIALIDYPSTDSSLKDGYAVVSREVAHADEENPVVLKVTGILGAGDPCHLAVTPGHTVRVLSGASIPGGADAVLAEEFAREEIEEIKAFACAERGRNILVKGSEISEGELLVSAGEVLTPAKISLAVAGGIEGVSVFRRPTVGLLATGDEVMLPGRRPEKGKLFASNLVLQDAWVRSRSMTTIVRQAGDSFPSLTSAVEFMLSQCDILITSGGAWKGDRDLIVKVLDQLGWDMLFHRVRMGPGKAVAMGLLGGKPVFCLPGGPPSNEAAFLLIAFPAVLRMAGHNGSPYLLSTGVLDKDVGGQSDWTQIIHCKAEKRDRTTSLTPLDSKKRLRSMAKADGLVLVPEGVESIPAGTSVEFISLADERVKSKGSSSNADGMKL